MKKRALIIGGFGLINALIVSGIGMSLAWYDSASLLRVDNIKVSFVGEMKVYVSTNPDGPFDTNTITNDEWGYSGIYYPVSSMYSDLWLNQSNIEEPLFRSAYRNALQSDESTYKESYLAAEGYFVTDLYFYTEARDALITIDPSATSFIPNEEKNQETVSHMDASEEKKAETLEGLNNAHKAVRFSILEQDSNNDYHYTIFDPFKDKETYFAGPLDLNADHEFDYYSESSTVEKEFMFGQYSNSDKIIYNDNMINDVDKYTSFTSNHAEGVQGIDFEASIANGFTPAIEQSVSINPHIEGNENIDEEIYDQFSFRINRFEVKKITLCLYVEGWDRDNTNITQAGSFIANIQFKGEDR